MPNTWLDYRYQGHIRICRNSNCRKKLFANLTYILSRPVGSAIMPTMLRILNQSPCRCRQNRKEYAKLCRSTEKIILGRKEGKVNHCPYCDKISTGNTLFEYLRQTSLKHRHNSSVHIGISQTTLRKVGKITNNGKQKHVLTFNRR